MSRFEQPASEIESQDPHMAADLRRNVDALSRRCAFGRSFEPETIGLVHPMPNPPHLGELITESTNELDWNVTATAGWLGCERGTLPRLLNRAAGASANMALARESGGVLRITGGGCRRATNSRRRVATGPPPNGEAAPCTRDSVWHHRCCLRCRGRRREAGQAR